MGRVIAVVLLVAVLGLALGLWVRTPGDRGAAGNYPRTPPAEGAAPATRGGTLADASGIPYGLAVVLEPCRRVGDSVRADGWIRNGLKETVRYVEVEVAWTDSLGVRVARGYYSVVGAETLMPGDSVPVRFATPDPRAARCSAEIYSYDPFL